MRSTPKTPAQVHSLSWHLLRGRRSHRASLTRSAKLSQKVEINRLHCDTMYCAAQAATSTTEVINAMWSNAQRDEPPELEPAIQIAPNKPLAPANGAARPITLTWLDGGAACLDIGDVTLSLSSDEAAVLRAIWSPSDRRGSE